MKISATRVAALVGFAALAVRRCPPPRSTHISRPCRPQRRSCIPASATITSRSRRRTPTRRSISTRAFACCTGSITTRPRVISAARPSSTRKRAMPYWGVALSIGPELQRHRRRRRARASDVRRRQERRAARRQRERARARLHRGAREALSVAGAGVRLARLPSRVQRSDARDGRRSIPTTSTRRRCSPRAS